MREEQIEKENISIAEAVKQIASAIAEGDFGELEIKGLLKPYRDGYVAHIIIKRSPFILLPKEDKK